MDGSVVGPKLAEFEQVAAARRAKSSRANPAAWSKEGHSVVAECVALCDPVRTRNTRIHQAVGPATAEAAAECRSMN